MANYLITGASTGIGAETAKLLAENNNLILTYYQSSDEAYALKKVLLQDYQATSVEFIKANLDTEKGCRELFDQIEGLTNKLDALVNNAGGMVARENIVDFNWQTMESIFRLNTFSLFQVTSLAVPLLRKSKSPCIVNLTSIASRHGGPGTTLYAAAKGAVDTFTKGAARELAPDIRVNSVSPGVIETPFHDKMSTKQQVLDWRDNNPLKRNGTAHDVALAIKFCIENTFVNGESIDVNGGLYTR
ncbi:SDR family NAD(P)-dependent oxidoreductase [Vibrio sp. S12_S33]|uniref:SDR family NAD(P)-dependent oxidoreductase n=1 Tax=Vibrio sp. S12_S33 TaxID=2720223 RepID=UPI0017833BAB|nr:SDR family oxidoreductase [Vibrio sp. S12_S33]MBD1567414.1 SDR family oxidoreductase [Vibrio sp. S12_S33]